MKIVHDLLSGPVFGMNSSVNNEADSTPDVSLKASVIAVRILIETDILPEPLRIQPPALRIGCELSVFQELRKITFFCCDGKL